MRPWVVGLTGCVGSGKSIAGRFLAELGVGVIDADQVAREVVAPGEPALGEIARQFGSRFIQPDGTLDRAALRREVFDDAGQRRRLEALLHPLIEQRLAGRLATMATPYAVLESPLLLETRQHELVDRILVIDTGPEQQIERTAARDGTSADAVRKIIAAQLPRQERLERADDVIVNDGSIDQLHNSLLALHERYLELASARAHGARS